MLLLIDNYDSFTYNLYQYFCELGAEVLVKRNDELQLADIERLVPQHLVISPALVPRMKRASRWPPSVILLVNYRSWVFVWGIRRWGRHLVLKWCAPAR